MTEALYRSALRAPVRGLWLDVFDIAQFTDAMFISVQRGFTRAWNQGLEDVGLRPEDQTQQERTELARRILSQVEFIGRFGNAIEIGSKANKGLLRVQFRRVETWVARYGETRMAARAMAGENKPLKWEIDPAKFNCTSCLRLNGKVKRASFWQDRGILPQVPNAPYLECKGFRCGCGLNPTTDPLSRGPLPKLP